MKTQRVMHLPVAKKMYEYKLKHATGVLTGKVKEARRNYQEYANLAVKNFDIAVQVPAPVKGTFPLFSKFGFNVVKYLFYNMFTKKTPEERQLKKMFEEYKTQKENEKAY